MNAKGRKAYESEIDKKKRQIDYLTKQCQYLNGQIYGITKDFMTLMSVSEKDAIKNLKEFRKEYLKATDDNK